MADARRKRARDDADLPSDLILLDVSDAVRAAAGAVWEALRVGDDIAVAFARVEGGARLRCECKSRASYALQIAPLLRAVLRPRRRCAATVTIGRVARAVDDAETKFYIDVIEADYAPPGQSEEKSVERVCNAAAAALFFGQGVTATATRSGGRWRVGFRPAVDEVKLTNALCFLDFLDARRAMVHVDDALTLSFAKESD